MDEINLRNYAYLGDAAWELYIRKKTILQTNNAQKLHKLTTNFVKTQFQCELLHLIEDILTPEEHEICRRARNLPIPVGRKKIQAEYRQATAFEALVGFWYINNKTRYKEIIKILEKYINTERPLN